LLFPIARAENNDSTLRGRSVIARLSRFRTSQHNHGKATLFMKPLHRLGIGALLSLVIVSSARAQDPEVARGVSLWRDSADARAAIRTLSNRLTLPLELKSEDRLRMHVYLSIALLSIGDTATAMRHVVAAVNQEPCLAIQPDVAPEAIRSVFAWARQYHVCNAMPPKRAMSLSLAAPGLGQVLGGRLKPGLLFMGGTLVALGSGAWLLFDSSSKYDQYKAATTPADAERLYQRANNARLLAAGALVTGAALWIGGAFEARHGATRRLDEISRARSYALRPALDGPAVGLSLEMRF
jgi:hypothetical protein